MDNCIFCKIAKGDIPVKKLYEDEQVVAFNDVNPQAPTHVLVIPHTHIATLNDLTHDNQYLIGHMATVAAKIAKDVGHAENGYRLVMNCNQDGGQSVFHIHMHLLSGRQMEWPPG